MLEDDMRFHHVKEWAGRQYHTNDEQESHAAMLRSMGIPAKVVTGYVGEENLYHAWIMVYIDGTWETAVFSVTPNTWSRCDVTFASTGATKYTGSGTSYTDRYTY